MSRRDGALRVKAIWRTLQGEGFFSGRPAVFVRFVGCNMWSGYEKDRLRDAERTGADCPLWCDTDFTKEGSRSFTASALAETIAGLAGSIRFCVLTGGEPLLQLNDDLIRSLHDLGFQVAIETNGTLSLEAALGKDLPDSALPDWIVCSPKLPQEQLNLEYFDELKLVVPDYDPASYAAFKDRARLHVLGGKPTQLLWLQPEDGPRREEAQQKAVNLSLEHPDWWVSVQIHKILDVD